jgi:hypothetical protein
MDVTSVNMDGARVRADATIYPQGNFKTNTIVRLSHRRPNSHCPRPRPSVHPSSSIRLTAMDVDGHGGMRYVGVCGNRLCIDMGAWDIHGLRE